MINNKTLSLTAGEKIALISNLSTMLGAGIPILETVDSILEDAKGKPRIILQSLHDGLMQGKQIHLTFALFPSTFDAVTVNIIKAAEEAGTLDVILIDLKNTIRKEMEFDDKIKSAFIYPGFIMVVFSAVLLMILIVVIPKISTVFSSMRVVLPLPTKILIAMSNALLHQTTVVLIGLVVIFGGGTFLYRRNKRMVNNLFIKLPVVSKLAKEIDLVRFTRSLYLLLNAGIHITNGLLLTQEVVLNYRIQNAIIHARESVMAGKKLSAAFKDNKEVIPSMMIKITEAGERSGSLDKSMADISEYFDYEVNNSLKLVTALLEPIMLVTVGVMVGGIMLAIIAPMYSIIGQVGH